MLRLVASLATTLGLSVLILWGVLLYQHYPEYFAISLIILVILVIWATIHKTFFSKD